VGERTLTGSSGGPLVPRRALLGAAASLGASAALVSCRTGASESGATDEGALPARPFDSVYQVGIAEPTAPFGLMAAFRCVDGDRGKLARTLQNLTVEARRLVDRVPAEQRVPTLPPAETGVLGSERIRIAVTVSVGASLFDDRYGLADRKPTELVLMPFLANDRLDPARTHGDLLITISADRPDACLHALRQLMRATRAGLVMHWLLDGYNRPDDVHVAGRTENRNLLGFKDGTSNLDVTDDAVMQRFVWITPEQGEPAWAVHGTYQAVRVVRTFVEHWDRTSLAEQERIIGRRKPSGAPLDGRRETDEPGFATNAADKGTPLDAHIRLARPRTAATEGDRLLRKGFSYSRGVDGAGTLDQGLAFVSYQARLSSFLAVTERLRGEPLEEYILPEGGGFYFVLPGVGDSRGWLGQSLLEA
jgi:deferrochelatase/peroxidase EfeB